MTFVARRHVWALAGNCQSARTELASAHSILYHARMARKSSATTQTSKKSSTGKTAARSKGRQPDHGLERRAMLMVLLLLGVLAVVAGAGGDSGPAALWLSDMSNRPADRAALDGRRIGVMVGHRGFDSGAICEDGRLEVETVERIAGHVERRLRRAGAQVDLLDEYDARLNGYAADALISIHADSCIDRSGFKVARWEESPIPAVEDRLVSCLSDRYAAATGLPFDADTITADMTRYHAFRKIAVETPGAIVETGFMGGDWDLIGRQPAVVADGIVDGLVCFWEDP
jgi:N-acetylmuramoyl-L-alanine amidase